MPYTNKVRAGLATAVLAVGLGIAGAGVAFAAPPLTTSSPVPGPDHDAQMDRMMNGLPADRQAAIDAMHDRMNPAVTTMMSGDHMPGHGPARS